MWSNQQSKGPLRGGTTIEFFVDVREQNFFTKEFEGQHAKQKFEKPTKSKKSAKNFWSKTRWFSVQTTEITRTFKKYLQKFYKILVLRFSSVSNLCTNLQMLLSFVFFHFEFLFEQKYFFIMRSNGSCVMINIWVSNGCKCNHHLTRLKCQLFLMEFLKRFKREITRTYCTSF